MDKIKAIIKFLPNTFHFLQEGDHVICAISRKVIPVENLNYWNVELQEAYYSPVEVKIKYEELKNR